MTDIRLRRLGVLVWILACSTASWAAEWHVDRTSANNVTFTSEVVSFSFEGTTDKVDGYLYWEGPGLFEGKPQLFFQVVINGFDTGIGKRDSDLRETLAAKEHPFTTYKGTIVSHEAIVDSSGVLTGHQVQTQGKLSLHGIERSVKIPGVITLQDSSASLQATFDLRLADYDIEAPSIAAFIKVSERIDIAVDLSLQRIK